MDSGDTTMAAPRATVARPTTMFTRRCMGKAAAFSRNSRWSLAKAMKLPKKVTEPMSPDRAVAMSIG